MKLLFSFVILITFSSYAQIGTGEWRLHVPTKNCIDVAAVGNNIYSAFVNGIVEYDTQADETSMWDNVNGLSDISISCLGTNSSKTALYVGYENGNIDVISNNKCTNIPAVVLANIQGNKKIYRIEPYENYVYVATGFSILKVDPIKLEIKETFYPTNSIEEIVDLSFRNDSIFALTPSKLYTGDLNNVALADPVQWTVDSRLPVLSTEAYQDIEIVFEQLFVSKKVDGYGLDTVLVLNQNESSVAFIPSYTMEINSLDNVDNQLVVNNFDASVFYDNSFNYTLIINDNSSYNIPSHVTKLNGKYWCADQNNGLFYTDNGFNFTYINIPGPPKNFFYKLDWSKGVLAVAGGGLANTVLTYNKAGAYTFEDEKWQLYDKFQFSNLQDKNIWDYVAVDVNPNNTNVIATSTFSPIPLVIIDRENLTADTITPYNSTIEFRVGYNDWSYVSDIEYDNDGNLWALNGNSFEPLKLMTPDKTWYSFNLGSSAIGVYTEDLVLDYNGNIWMAFRHTGVIGYNTNGTPTDPSDDKKIVLNTGENTGNLPSGIINAIAVDFDNEIWIGTDDGFAILYNSENAFDAGLGEYNAQQPKIEYEGNVEYVLSGTNVTDIEVDGANRKWIGTSGAGIALLSADGLEILEQYTTENSPLISNNILDLELDQNTGELYIATDIGMISYRTDATYGKDDYESVTVFPNPARPDFDGVITIQGIKYDSDVKITDAAGNLIYTTTSNGGTATWNGKTLNGDRVATGVYLIWTSPNEGKGRFVGKVLIVNE